MKQASVAGLLLLSVGLWIPSVATAHSPVPETKLAKSRADCVGFANQDLSTTLDAPAELTSVVYHEATGELPALCELQGVVWRSVRFQMKLPLHSWNRRILAIAPEGQAGQLMTDFHYLFFGGRPGVLKQGYATITHDAGHPAAGTKWAWHNEVAMIDYGFRAGHVAAVISKEIVRRFYGVSALRSYHHSCSNGGREGMMMAQRYPSDYDGIIAGAPSMSYANQFLGLFWLGAMLSDRSTTGLDETAVAILHQAVLKQCDKIDGKLDGILEDPRKCKVDLRSAICPSTKNQGCLTSRQAELARKIYDGPRRADGTQIALPTAMPGSELTWPRQLQFGKYAEDLLRFQAFDPSPGPGWNPDINDIETYRDRMRLLDILYSPNNPDLSTFRDRGGKMLIYFGWNDAIGGVLSPIEYYENAVKLNGSIKSTRSFFQLYMMPGMNHCSGGDGASVFDYLDAMDKWSFDGKTPASITGYKPRGDGSPEFFKTINPY